MVYKPIRRQTIIGEQVIAEKQIIKRRKNAKLLSETKIEELAKILCKQIDREIFERKSAPAREILKLVGAGAFLAGSLVFPNLPKALKPFLNNQEEYQAWKRFNIPYLKRALERLEKQRLVEKRKEGNQEIIKITEQGRHKILKFAMEELAIEKPFLWDGSWRLVSYDLPEKLKEERKILQDYLLAWGFYPWQKSVYLHAYPCEKEIEFLREYLGIGKYVRILLVSKIENDKTYREFFGV